MASSVKIPASFSLLNNSINKAVENSIKDCTADLYRVAQARTPVKTTTLEKNGSMKNMKSGTSYIGEVSFKAINNGYNYALKMDKGKYNLGEKSLAKSSRGVRSKFSNETFKVGSGYLSDTAEKCEKGYIDYINKQVSEVINAKGFSKNSK